MLGILKKLFGGGQAVDYKGLQERGAIVIDVRTRSEFASGHIEGALNIPLDSIKSQIAQLKKRNKPVITCCRSGSRSGMAKSMLSGAGIECYNGGPWNSLQQKLSKA
ncbi:MAG TPA: rhodanese-like domain-containing protein [Phnomibacter sp.]|nr:rhodanese-like domain-containing protein [Phnomibacter sp.]